MFFGEDLRGIRLCGEKETDDGVVVKFKIVNYTNQKPNSPYMNSY